MKRGARKSLKKHYFIFVAVCLIAAYLGSEFPTSISRISLRTVSYTHLVIVLFIPALFAFVLPDAFTGRVIRSILKIAGFMENGTINFLYPLLFLLTMCGIFYVCAYLVIRRTELKS